MHSQPGTSADRATLELQRRLEEAEETLRAIREGEVDALVMRNPQDEDEVFTLEGGTESYRAFMEVMEIGAAAFDVSGRLIYANKALLMLLGMREATLDTDIFQSLGKAQRSAIADAIHMGLNAKVSREMVLNRPDGEHHVQLSASPLTLGLSRGVAVTFTDITARIQALAALESERAAHAVIASANEAVIVCDVNGIITHANAAVEGVTAQNPIGLPFSTAIPIVVPDATGLVEGNEFVSLAISGSAVQGIEAHAPQAPRIKDLLISAAPLRLGERIAGCVVTMVDLSQRKALEKRQLLLMGELDHRVKNTLALVLSIAKRTGTPDGTVESFKKAFASRIQALAATHNILAERSWDSVALREIVRVELEPYLGEQHARLQLTGQDFRVKPQAAISLGLILHELAANAAKYGALSSLDGHVDVTIHDNAEGGASLEWREQGGPPVFPPTRAGFGQTVITRSMQYAADGGAEMRYDPDGVWCVIRIPATEITRMAG